jgi:prepilin-type N-terminal cleavage/methylation domain-containing protein
MLRRERGVTLIELAVVMAIVAIMALFLAPAIGEWVDNFRIRQAGRDIVSHLQLAKIRAISSGLQYRVRFDLANDEYLVEKNEGYGNKREVCFVSTRVWILRVQQAVWVVLQRLNLIPTGHVRVDTSR